MKNLLWLLLCSLFLLVSGCSLAIKPAPKVGLMPQVEYEQWLEKMHLLQNNKNTDELALLIHQAHKTYPDDERINKAWARQKNESLQQQAYLKDRLLLNELSALYTEMSLNAQLTTKDSISWLDNIKQQQQAIRLHQGLLPLEDCGRRNSKQQRELALSCIDLALKIEPSDSRLALKKKLQSDTARNKKQQLEVKRRQREKQLYGLAKKNFDAGNYTASLRLATKVIKMNPQHKQAQKIKKQSTAFLQEQTQLLMEVGVKWTP
ncbi:MAG: hypothetical protein KZQ58_02800 [gamma proteobacterium symbiont of Bathyaustriella thionipta]|nr:hypothetical protein [gamma proteobacterium symbiont of Bathyaustriella thionipta]